MGTAHLSYLSAMSKANFLRSAAHECVLRDQNHSELPLFFGSLLAVPLVLIPFNAGQSYYSTTLYRIAGVARNVNVVIVYALSMLWLLKVVDIAMALDRNRNKGRDEPRPIPQERAI